MKILQNLFIVCFILVANIISAQDKSNISHSIDSKIFDKEREVKVFLPETYHRDSISKYPVVYVLDAQSESFWGILTGNAGYMVDNYSVMPMIFVGIVSDNRGPEFNPKNAELHNHFKKEVFPLIESNYRTEGFRAVLGHSWGGAFVGNTLFSDKRDMFDAYIGISPSFGDTDDNIIVKNADTLLQKNTEFGKYLYFSHGDVGRREVEFERNVNNIDVLVKKYPNNTLSWQPRLIKGVGHWQIVGPSICDGLLSMSRNYFADQKVIQDFAKSSKGNLKEKIEDFYKTRKAIFGYSYEASAGYLNFVANDFRDLNDYETALEVYNLALNKKPNSVRVYVNMCDVYDKMGDKKVAKTFILKTQKLLEEQKDDVSDNYYKNISKWIKEKLESYN
ncbi:tetratricopeptide repeat protein [Hyunsoonleella flava]|uniref:Tetratricopeptide repeat protein n=1 Tax=Hyunsoonleella flava TaxID=2527939 RepID=A0A4Q9FK54_9FLAO|nr:alpha/beta hydrolase-fold protein [Hyunsoonleella flava]TBN04439.1 tetratricopeptide repeat protein [Hyunsoonleella flava]